MKETSELTVKKFTDFIKPNILIIFGALLLIMNLNALSAAGTALALGIVAVIISVYYLAVGILLVIMGNKFSPTMLKVFETLSVSLFAVFMFVRFLLTAIGGGLGLTDWVIIILSMVSSLALVIVYIMFKFADAPNLLRFTYLFALIFVLALLLDVLFSAGGTLGGIDVFLVAIYAAYSFYLFGALNKDKEVAAQETQE
ncbi:MAG: hypothetical protein IJQ07_01835 [Clostridia bacterium]|nr:hypothetical protein [Clostridia bacterium]